MDCVLYRELVKHEVRESLKDEQERENGVQGELGYENGEKTSLGIEK